MKYRVTALNRMTGERETIAGPAERAQICRALDAYKRAHRRARGGAAYSELRIEQAVEQLFFKWE